MGTSNIVHRLTVRWLKQAKFVKGVQRKDTRLKTRWEKKAEEGREEDAVGYLLKSQWHPFLFADRANLPQLVSKTQEFYFFTLYSLLSTLSLCTENNGLWSTGGQWEVRKSLQGIPESLPPEQRDTWRECIVSFSLYMVIIKGNWNFFLCSAEGRNCWKMDDIRHGKH